MTSPLTWTRVSNAYRRRAARWFARRPFTIQPGRPIVSFTFDDFPRSALEVGGAVLESHGFVGTFYASLGLSGTRGDCGLHFNTNDLRRLLARGHELGCHTFDHCAAWETWPARFEASVRRNDAALRQAVPGARFRSLSYPISYPQPATKQRISRHFVCCRGGGQTFNCGTVDANYLASYFLEQTRDGVAEIERLLRENESAGGWLIFSTHDIALHPSRFGCPPEFFRQVVKRVAQSGALVLPVFGAWKHLLARASAHP